MGIQCKPVGAFKRTMKKIENELETQKKEVKKSRKITKEEKE